MQLHVGVLLAAVLILQLASSQAMQCHQCKGFGGCSHVSRCPWDSTHCIAIATLPLDTKSPRSPPQAGPPAHQPTSPSLCATVQHHFSS
ncbi:secreted Ly-6/uPAR domain-containing protein 2 isoform 2 precursor, partial [Daubentonia madagascariensis]